MTEPEPNAETEFIKGVMGTAERIPIPDEPRFVSTCDHWLLSTPGHVNYVTDVSTQFTFADPQYILACIRLDEREGFDPPLLAFIGATHEIDVLTLDPEPGAQTPEKLLANPGGSAFLPPVNISEQFESTDHEMRTLCAWLAWGVVHGHLVPELGAQAPMSWKPAWPSAEATRASWKSTMIKTLAHIRGEYHAS